MIPKRFAVRVAGVSFRDDYPDNLYALQEQVVGGARIEASLIRDPDNPHDRNAIAVLSGGSMVGFVPREMAIDLAPALDAGEQVRVLEAEVIIHREHPDRPGFGLLCERVSD